MFGLSNAKRPTQQKGGNIETDSLVISKGGFFNGNVAKIKEQETQRGPRLLYLVEEKRIGQQKSG